MPRTTPPSRTCSEFPQTPIPSHPAKGLALPIALLLLLLSLGGLARAQPPAGGAEPWGLSLGGAPDTALELETVVQVEVTGLLARVLVLQAFRNDSDEWLEGLYRFPLPDGAAVDRLFIRVGERVLEGEIQERLEAQRLYQAARDAGQSAGLVEQERANQFQTRVANIGPGEEISILIGFLATVEYRDGVFSLRLPGTFTPRHGAEPQPGTGSPAPRPVLTAVEAGARRHGGSAPSVEVIIDLPADPPLAHIESRHHDVEIVPREDGYRVRLARSDELPDRDFVLDWAPELGFAPRAALSGWADERWHYAQLMLIPPLEEALEAQARELVFVIDSSGSMQGASMEQARRALEEGIEGLEAGDRFNVLRFDDDTERLFKVSRPASAANREQALRWVRRLRADGGTNMAPALRSALRLPRQEQLLRQVVFVTDGAVGNERQLLGLIAEELGTARLFTVSIGAAPNSWFMRKAAEIGRGTHTHIGRPEEVAGRMTALWSRIRVPALSDICVDWGPGAEYYPEIVPDLYAGDALWVTARLPSAPGPVGLCGQLNGQPWELIVQPPEAEGSETLATLWARRKVEALQDGLVFGADPAQVREQVTRVALDHELLTPYTSLVAVDRTPRRDGQESLAQGRVPSLLPAGSSAAVAGFAGTATGWKSQLLLSAGALLLTSWWLFNPQGRLPTVLRRGSTDTSRRSDPRPRTLSTEGR